MRALLCVPILLLAACQGSGETPDDDTAVEITLVINEIMATNTSTVEDEAGAYPDWIELHNTGAAEIDLAGYYLSDDLANPTRWQFAGGSSIAGGGYLLVWADGDVDDGADHSSFSLAADGEELGLFSPVSAGLGTVDSITFGAQSADISMARQPDGADNWEADTSPTPGASNE